ncbi:MAG: lysylphosphatidylglycerol synthase domain-containing protein [Pseudomonadota bacterium]
MTSWPYSLSRLTTIARQPGVRKALLVAATVVLGIGLLWALNTSADVWSRVQWGPLLAVLFLIVPAVTLVNAYEFRVSAHLLGKEYSALTSLEVTVMGTATNLLPVPGGTIVRVSALRTAGASMSDSVQATLLAGILWVGLTLSLAGTVLLVHATYIIGACFALPGIMILASTLWRLTRLSINQRATSQLVVSKLVIIVLDTLRIHLCLAAIGVEIDFSNAMVLTASTVVGSSMSIVPAGLGVREWTQAALAPLVGVSVADSFLSAVLVRILGLVFIVPLAFALAVRSGPRSQSDARGS